MAVAKLVYYGAIAALALVLAGILLAYLHLVAPLTGFLFFIISFFLSLIGVIVGLIAIVVTRTPERRVARPHALIGTVISLAIALPIITMVVRGMKYPPINDITTDVDSPPEFVFALTIPQNQGRDMKYDKAKYAARQQAGYGIIAPLKERIEPSAAFARVLDVAQKIPTWKVTYSDPSKNTLEAVATSKLFHFQDDVIVEIRPSPDGASLIEMRSKSRDGTGDFGVNRRRLRRFFGRIALSRGPSDNEDMP
ncbi:MAG: DUF1499 domain-containing protein [Candidatus Binatus sp.]|uniref:DUF1499 domain-containing protein n=1 Tax=Candidatus Binatus sp. TaxID=2811406 RepID=UPI00271987A0|nr:DUF1499 domain-containing protein [Candidatus Binatus sp.]MDO8432274.1 DUF1499 domain-containing protein [Candidatus Binatus sp.]